MKTGRDGIRELMRGDYQRLKGHGGYRAVGKLWGVSAGVVWKMINEPGYWPKDKEIKKIIEDKAGLRGIRIKKRGRKRDFLSDVAW